MVSASTGSGKTALHPAGAATRAGRARRQRQTRAKGRGLRPAHPGARADARTGDARSPRRPTSTAATCRACAWPRWWAACRTRRADQGAARPLDILIATPGRLLDHLQTGKAVLEHVEMLVLDEADRMLDMGFIDDITTIADHVPAARQTVMYSATFAGNVGGWRNSCCASRSASTSPRTPTRTPTSNSACTGPTTPSTKNALLDHILTERELEQAVIFTSTQRDADWLADRLADMGHAVALAARRHAAGPAHCVLQACAQAPTRARRHRRGGARHRRADHQPRHQLRPADEDRGLRCTASGRTGRAGRTAGGDAGRAAHGRGHDPPHPALHHAGHSVATVARRAAHPGVAHLSQRADSQGERLASTRKSFMAQTLRRKAVRRRGNKPLSARSPSRQRRRQARQPFQR